VHFRAAFGPCDQQPYAAPGTRDEKKGTDMADPMKIRATLQGDTVEVRVLMQHEMETGQRKDAAGKTIPAWHIQQVSATSNGKTVLSAQWGPAVSKNPFLSFKFKGGAKGDKVQITWTDNKGDKRTDEVVVS
jgi:sulfur-oxidizing protein SoxZ